MDTGKVLDVKPLMDTGKVLDVKPLSKVCKKCREHENDADTPENAAWRADQEPNYVRPLIKD